MTRRSFVYERSLPGESTEQMPSQNKEREYSLNRVAQRLDMPVRAVYRMKDEGQLEVYKRGPKKNYIVMESELVRVERELQKPVE